MILQGLACLEIFDYSVIFENLSTTTKIESFSFFLIGNPKTKSMEMSIKKEFRYRQRSIQPMRHKF
jgi:hypothetical protein